MNPNSGHPKDQKDKHAFLVEVTNIEKQLWALIHSKGLLHPDVRELYRKATSTYENVLLNNLKQTELHDIEYSLWKLHYKHIDEFRKRIRTVSSKSVSKSSLTAESDDLVEEFESFLSRASDFYRNLIVNIRRYYGAGITFSVEQYGIRTCKFLCHRFSVCLGDIARYREQYQKSGDEEQDWSSAATHYLEAAKLWPDSGNPHNQLAVLATYVGDEFLALYHCIRSFSVEEPFPDAWNNLILLFEKNRSKHLPSLRLGTRFDFSKPSKRSSGQNLIRGASEVEKDFTSAEFWSLVVRTMSFFFLRSSSDSFNGVFASTMREFDAMLVATERTFESYRRTDLALRILRLISVIIFVFHHLTVKPEIEQSSGDDTFKEQLELKHLGLAISFVLMGRFVERCLKTKHPSSSPFFPGILVFVEFLQFDLDVGEDWGFDDRSSSAMIYFFDALTSLLNRLIVDKRGILPSPERTALWEDLELRGFYPVSSSHTSLDFSSCHQDHEEGYKNGIEFRFARIINAALRLADRDKGSLKLFSFDKLGDRFYTADWNVDSDGKELIPEENGKSFAAEEEEVIVFNPLARYNSMEEGSPKTGEDQTVPSEECLRRATSRLIAQNPVENNVSDLSNFRFNEALKQPDSPSKQTLPETLVLAGPPSLSGWVINDDNKNGKRDFKLGLMPIDELASGSSSSCSSTHESADSAHGLYSATPYSLPIPSAPLVPEDASWFPCTDKAENFHSSSQKIEARENGIQNYGLLPVQDLKKGFPVLPFQGISSSEWLRRYRENQKNLKPGSYPDVYTTNADSRNILANGSSKFGLLDRYGTPAEPVNYTKNSQTNPGLSHLYTRVEHQKTNPFSVREDPRPLLQSLQKKEWLIQQDQHHLRGPSFTRN